MSVLYTRGADSSPIWPSPMRMSVAFAPPWRMTAVCAYRPFIGLILEGSKGSI
jgi:hypothetical protein